MSAEQAIEILSLIGCTFFAYQAYGGLSFGVFRVRGMTKFTLSVCGALIIIWAVVHNAQIVLGWFGFGLHGYARYAADLLMILVVFGFGGWIALTRAKASPQAIFDVFIWPILAGIGFEGAANIGVIKLGFVETVRLLSRHL